MSSPSEADDALLKRYCSLWQALWPEDLLLEFAVSSTQLAGKLLREAEKADHRPKRLREYITDCKGRVFNDYAQAAAGNRDEICEKVFRARLDIEDYTGRQHVGVPDVVVPFADALRRGDRQAIATLGKALTTSLDDDDAVLQKAVWLLLVEYPYAFRIRDEPDLAAVRLLPDFCGGTRRFRQSLSAHIIQVCDAWNRLLTEDACESALDRLKMSPLARVESGAWWVRIVLEAIADQKSSQIPKWVSRHLQEICSSSVIARELEAYSLTL